MKVHSTIYAILSSALIWSCNEQSPKITQYSPSSQEIEVRQVVLDLFQAMYDGDSSKASKVFRPEAKLYSIFQQNDSTQWHEGSVPQFLTAIGSPHNVKWIEKSWDYQITIDDGLAQVWCQYAFFAGERFSHCGVDAFQLVHTHEGWKIFSLADTRRKDGCIFPTGEFFEPK
ncbi:nuclear transport factor 2 family protein [Reichenbachiella agarivorans]|uniref:Nuclear transport factor 2 family protein n=1 Tax=Reichenbachiella agarivorans TaxID=2979464 RepID=A0ABY6CRM0_9BACT|nr:nuclear transport factor 2 family protein [Reichenbachiella agarivorans]UXP33161.1 nuclear transport factor 2 family protein [Reichenbachiella agarivorans]